MGAAVQPTSAWEQWRTITDGIEGGFETRLSGPTSAFRGSLQRYCVLGLNYTSIETNARSLVRGKLENSGGNHYCLVYQARGRSLARQGKSIAMLNQSDMVLGSPDEDLEFINRGTIRHLSFLLPRAVLCHAIGTDEVPLAVPIQSKSPIGSLLSAMLMQAHSRSQELSMMAGENLATATACLLAPLVTGARPRPDIDDSSPDTISTLTVLRFIDSNLRNPNLSPAYISRALNCSARHVHRAFEGSGLTVSAYIKRERLRGSARDLTAAENRGDSVTEIAIRWGFSDISHFSRSFRAEFGMAPRDYREQGQPGDWASSLQ